jgi:hypothetical protein
VEELYADVGDAGADRTMAMARALRALLESVRGRLGRLQVGRALDAARARGGEHVRALMGDDRSTAETRHRRLW